jgi:hypothetical protein
MSEDDRRQVPPEERRAIARGLAHLLTIRDDSGRKKWSQSRLGEKVGLSQESIRRALAPSGVGPTIRDQAPILFGMTIAEIVERYGADEDSGTIDAALLELIYEHPERASAFTVAAKSLKFDRPDGLDLHKAKINILALAAEAKGKSGDGRETSDAEEGTPGGPRGGFRAEGTVSFKSGKTSAAASKVLHESSGTYRAGKSSGTGKTGKGGGK